LKYWQYDRHKLHKENNALFKSLAFLVHPNYDVNDNDVKSIISADPKVVYSILAKNKVIARALYICNASVASQNKIKLIQQILNRNIIFREKYKKINNDVILLLKILSLFENDGIEVLFIKPVKSLPLDSDNYDVLIRPNDLARARELLENWGFFEVRKVREPFKWLFRKITSNKEDFAVHLHTKVGWHGISFLNEGLIWRQKREVDLGDFKIFVPSYEDNVIISVTHLFFENLNITLRDLIFFFEVFSSSSLNWSYIRKIAERENHKSPLFSILNLSDLIHRSIYNLPLLPHQNINFDFKDENIMKLSAHLSRNFKSPPELPFVLSNPVVIKHLLAKLYKENILTSRKYQILYRVAKGYINRRLVEHPNFNKMLICYSGVDGSGKTTHAKTLSKELISRDIRTSNFWMRGHSLFLSHIFKLARKSLFHQNQISSTLNTDIIRRSYCPIILKALAYSTMLDRIWFFLKIRMSLYLRNVVICDRYTNDTILDLELDLRINCNKCILAKIIKLLSPKPDVLFILDTPEDVLSKRKDDENISILKSKRAKYLKYASKKRFPIIDTTKPLEENMKLELFTVLKKYYF